MTDLPEQIWAYKATEQLLGNPPIDQGKWVDHDQSPWGAVKYIRADLVPTWQPIETAPADVFLLVKHKLEVHPFVACNHDVLGWIDQDFDEIGHTEMLSHWMPLPQMPNEVTE